MLLVGTLMPVSSFAAALTHKLCSALCFRFEACLLALHAFCIGVSYRHTCAKTPCVGCSGCSSLVPARLVLGCCGLSTLVSVHISRYQSCTMGSCTECPECTSFVKGTRTSGQEVIRIRGTNWLRGTWLWHCLERQGVRSPSATRGPAVHEVSVF